MKFLINFCLFLIIIISLIFDIVKIEGNSMKPDYEEGSIVIVSANILGLRKTKPGDIVVFKNPETERLNIKRCSAAYKDTVFLTGTNLSESTDSRHFGRIPKNDILGWVWIKI